MANKYVFYKIFDGQIVVMQDALGRVHYHTICPCTGGVYKDIFVDLIEFNPQFMGHIAQNLPHRPGEYPTEITYSSYDDDNWSITNAFNFMFQQRNFFNWGGRLYQQTVPVTQDGEAFISLYPQTSRMVRDMVVSGTSKVDYSDVWHWNKVSGDYLSTHLHVPLNNNFYTYLSSISFNNVDYTLNYNQFEKNIDIDWGLSGKYYSNNNSYFYDQDDEYYLFKPYNGICHDRKEYYITRVMSGANTAYCFNDRNPQDQISLDDLADYFHQCDSTRTLHAGDYIYRSKDRYNDEVGVVPVNDKFYYYDKDLRLVMECNKEVESAMLVPSTGFENPVSPYYTGFAAAFKKWNEWDQVWQDDVRYLYTKPSAINIDGYDTGKVTVRSENVDYHSGWITDYYSDKYSLSFDSTSGWYFVEYYDRYDPENNTYVLLNDYLPEPDYNPNSPPLYWDIDSQTFYTYNSPYRYVDFYYGERENDKVQVIEYGSGYYAAYSSKFYKVQYNLLSGYYIQTSEGSDPIIFSGYTDAPPPYYWQDDNEQYIQVYKGQYYKLPDDDYLILPVTAWYDKRFGDLINMYAPKLYQDENNINIELKAAALVPKYVNRNLSPFIIYKSYRYDWWPKTQQQSEVFGQKTMGQFLSSDYLINDDDYYIDENRKNYLSGYLLNYILGEDGTNLFQFGHDNGYNTNVSRSTFMFTKPTPEQIEDYLRYEETFRQFCPDGLSTVINNLQGVYCQILTGIWIYPSQTSDDTWEIDMYKDLSCQFRQYGFTYQTLQFDKEYAFCPWFYSDQTLTSYFPNQSGYVQMITNLNNLDSTAYSDFTNDFDLSIPVSTFFRGLGQYESTQPGRGCRAFQGAYYVRPISGVTTLDGSEQLNLAPAALTSQSIPED